MMTANVNPIVAMLKAAGLSGEELFVALMETRAADATVEADDRGDRDFLVESEALDALIQAARAAEELGHNPHLFTIPELRAMEKAARAKVVRQFVREHLPTWACLSVLGINWNTWFLAAETVVESHKAGLRVRVRLSAVGQKAFAALGQLKAAVADRNPQAIVQVKTGAAGLVELVIYQRHTFRAEVKKLLVARKGQRPDTPAMRKHAAALADRILEREVALDDADGGTGYTEEQLDRAILAGQIDRVYLDVARAHRLDAASWDAYYWG